MNNEKKNLEKLRNQLLKIKEYFLSSYEDNVKDEDTLISDEDIDIFFEESNENKKVK